MKFSAIKCINIYKILQNAEAIIYLYFYKILKMDEITKKYGSILYTLLKFHKISNIIQLFQKKTQGGHFYGRTD